MVEDVVDCDEHLAGDSNDGSVMSSTFHYSQIELVESWVVTCGVLGGFEYPADVAVAFLCDRAMGRSIARLMGAGCEACIADKFLRRRESRDWSDLV